VKNSIETERRKRLQELDLLFISNGLLTTEHEHAKREREREINKDYDPFLEYNKGSVIVIASRYKQILVCTYMILDLLHLA
jgi:hypothetical protein